MFSSIFWLLARFPGLLSFVGLVLASPVLIRLEGGLRRRLVAGGVIGPWLSVNCQLGLL